METLLEIFVIPVGLANWHFLLLCFISFLGSLITASIGLGGGTLTLATMALLMTPGVLIPVHGAVQLGSNLGRAILMRKSIIYNILPVFILGTVIGALFGGHAFTALPIGFLQLVLAFFILFTTWAPLFTASKGNKLNFLGIGSVGAFTTMFVGATGPLILPFVVATSNDRREIVGSHASLMTIQHTLKMIVFGLIGFSFASYLPLIICLTVFGFFGTYIGKIALNRLPEKIFRILLKFILTIMAIKLTYDGFSASF